MEIEQADYTIIQILAEFGLPVAAALIMGLFIYLIIKYILESVVGQVKTMHAIITVSYTHLTLPTNREV